MYNSQFSYPTKISIASSVTLDIIPDMNSETGFCNFHPNITLKNSYKTTENRTSMTNSTYIYTFGFTTGSLMIKECVKTSELYLKKGKWNSVRESLNTHNILQIRTLSSRKRLTSEVIGRLKKLTSAQLELFAKGNFSEQKAIAWLAACKKYNFLADFAQEVVREKFLKLDYNLTKDDYRIFFNAKTEWHEELEALKKSTKQKIEQQVFKMLKEADIIDSKGTIMQAFFTQTVIDAIKDDNKSLLSIFPVFDNITGI